MNPHERMLQDEDSCIFYVNPKWAAWEDGYKARGEDEYKRGRHDMAKEMQDAINRAGEAHGNSLELRKIEALEGIEKNTRR